MIVLRDILALIHYQTEAECIAYVQLLAYRGAFQNPILGIERKIEQAPILATFGTESFSVWRKLGLHDEYPTHLHQIISEREAIEFLQLSFDSLEEGYKWLLNVTNLFFLRETFWNEGIRSHNAHNSSINTKRWLTSGPEENPLVINSLYDCAERLHLTGGQPWPTNKTSNHVVLFGGLEHIVKTRIDFIEAFSGTLYYLTGPRGLFNYEPTLAPILSQWFGMPEKIATIQAVLDQYQDSNTTMQWTMNLSALKTEILTAVGADTWPLAPQSYYYQNQHEYDLHAIQQNWEPLNCLGGPWPVAMDLVDFYMKKRSWNQNVRLIPIVALGTNGHLAGVSDELELWYKNYGRTLLLIGEHPIFVTCNKVHALPHVLSNIMHHDDYQRSLTQQNLLNKANLYRYGTRRHEHDFQISNQITIVGPKASMQDFNIQHALDSLAKEVFSLQPIIKKSIDEYNITKSAPLYSPVVIVEKMILHHQQQEYLRLANSAFDLGIWFYFTHHLIKVVGLLNFALNVLAKMKDYEVDKVVNALDDCTDVTTQDFIMEKLKKQEFPDKSVDRSMIHQIKMNNKLSLRAIRDDIERTFMAISKADSALLIDCHQKIWNEMHRFLVGLITQSNELLNDQSLKYSLVAMGSYSTIQATPFSDLESFVIIENDEPATLQQVKDHIKFLLILIINLGETTLPSLGIQVTDEKGTRADFMVPSMWDIYTPRGFSFDGAFGDGYKTPLGKNIDGNRCYRLIGTPESLVNQFVVHGVDRDPVLPQMMHSTRLIYGDESLYVQFTECLSRCSFNKEAYVVALLQKNLSKFAPLLELTETESIHHKNRLYNPVHTLVNGLFLLFAGNRQCTMFDKIDYLFENRVITTEQRGILKDSLALCSYARLQQYFKFKSAKIEISSDEPQFQPIRESNRKLKQIYGFFEGKLNNKTLLDLPRPSL